MTDTSDGAATSAYGYNLVDVGPLRQSVDALPAGQRALVWLDGYDRSTCSFSLNDAGLTAKLASLAGDPRIAGYYIADEPDDGLPAFGGHCPDVAAQITARNALVHRLAPGPFTYEVVTEPQNFAAFAHATDVLGADPYPCRVGRACDTTLIPRTIAALRQAHVSRYWGVLQAFGDSNFRYPTAAELRAMIQQWQASSWEGEQTFAWTWAGNSLTAHPDLLAVLASLNQAASTPAPTSTTASAPDGTTGAGSPVSKVLVVMEENHSTDQVLPAGMPYLWTLARRYGYATDWSDVNHPSLPNYLAIVGGSDFGSPQDCTPGPGCTATGTSVFGQALSAGKTATTYAESMPVSCDRSDSGDYDVNHNPWAYFPAEAGRCGAHDVAAGTTSGGALATDIRNGALPTVGLVAPNLAHDAHNGTLAAADSWLHDWMTAVMAGPDWQAGRLAVVVVFDEGETTETVPFVMIAPGVNGAVVHQALNHYALTRLLDQVIGAPPLRAAASAPDIRPLFGLH